MTKNLKDCSHSEYLCSFDSVQTIITGDRDVLRTSIQASLLVAQTVKNLPAIQETWDQSLGQEDPLQEGMATCSSILDWRSPRTDEPDGLQSMGPKALDD